MSLSAKDQDALVSLAFSINNNRGAYALLLGAGVSVPAGINGAWDVLMTLVAQSAAAEGAEAPADPEQWYRDKHGKPPTYQGFLAAMARSQEERQRMLRPYFDPTERDLKPTAAHRAIAQLVKSGHVRVILTVNFDKLMEDALNEVGIHPTVIETPAKLGKGLSPIHTLDCCVIHLHGDYLSPAAMLNTDDELGGYVPELESLIKRILGDYGLIMAGWSSVYDQALRELIERNYPGRYTPTWIEPYAQSAVASDLLVHLKGTLVQADADESLGFLAEAIASIAEKRGRHPLMISTAASMAKRELSGQRTSISLHDIFHQELERLASIPEFTLPADHSELIKSPGYEGGAIGAATRAAEASKVAATIAACLAYWGDETTDRWLFDAIARFSTPMSTNLGPTLANMSLIAGQALFYSAGVAAVAGRRWDLAVKLLKIRRPRPGLRDVVDPVEPLLRTPGPMQVGELRAFKVLYPGLCEALALGEETVERAWETFEVFRIMHAIAIAPGVEDGLTNVAAASEAFDRADTARQQAGDADLETRIKRTGERDEALRESHAARRHLGANIVVYGLHIQTASGANDQLYCPEAARLASDAEAMGAIAADYPGDARGFIDGAPLVINTLVSDAAEMLINPNGFHPMSFMHPRWLDEERS
ncbi:SIR2 family protein [bacterium RCC_150]